MPTLLIADDAASVRTLVQDYFEAQGFTAVAAEDGTGALAKARELRPDLLVLDVMMPGLDGFEIVRQLRGEIPIILLTARVEEIDRVLGLELGADDYVTKPFSLHELGARVRAVLRRSQRDPPAAAVLREGEVVLDQTRHRVEVDVQEISLTPSEFTVLETLMVTPGRVFSRAQLLDALGSGESGSERTVDVHVRNLRAKIEADPSAPAYVQTVFGVGYRFGP